VQGRGDGRADARARAGDEGRAARKVKHGTHYAPPGRGCLDRRRIRRHAVEVDACQGRRRVVHFAPPYHRRAPVVF
jgi:hypothetical protein